MSDTLRQAEFERLVAVAERALAGGNSNTPGATQGRTHSARIAVDVVLADPTVARWKAAHEAAAYFISQYPTVQLAEERQWDPALDALARSVTPTAGETT